MKRRVTYRPGKANGLLGGVMGGIFVVIGIVMVIPAFGLFGILWTAMAAAIMGFSLYTAFGKGYIGPDIEIEDDGSGAEETAEERLRKLQSLYDRRLITPEEYEEKRKEILRQL